LAAWVGPLLRYEDRRANRKSVTFPAPALTNDQGEIEVLALNILGLRFVLMLEALDIGKYPFLRDAKFRPGRTEISYPSSTNWVTMSWADGKRHRETLTVKFVQLLHRRQTPVGSPTTGKVK
jgi:hypothetical protein